MKLFHSFRKNNVSLKRFYSSYSQKTQNPFCNLSFFQGNFGKLMEMKHVSKNIQVFMFNKRSLIITEPTPNPESLKFYPQNEVILGEGTMDFPTFRSATYSPLAKELFSIPSVKRVFLGPNFVTVTKKREDDWIYIKPLIFAKIEDFFASGKPVISEVPVHPDTAPCEGDSEIVSMIKEILETRVRPAVQEDGGDIVYQKFQDGIVFLKMQGSCSGCPSSAVTLKSGIERMLMHWVPEVQGVVAADDEDLEKINLEELQKTDKKIEGKTLNS